MHCGDGRDAFLERPFGYFSRCLARARGLFFSFKFEKNSIVKSEL